MVAHDLSNPFRELIPLATHHAFLLQILIATSAVHMSNVTRPVDQLPAEPFDPGGRRQQVPSDDMTFRRALVDSLAAKQQAIRHLRVALSSSHAISDDVVLVGIFFFVNFDLIYIGKADKVNIGWKSHLQGARKIMAALNETRPWPTESDSRIRLRESVMADCLM